MMKRGIMYLYKKITCSSGVAKDDLQEEQQINQCNKLNSATLKSNTMPVAMDSSSEQQMVGSVSVIVNDDSDNTLPESLQELKCSESPCLCKTVAEEDIMVIKNDLDIVLNNICPLNYYDFCLITCEADYKRALEFRSQFCQKYKLKGCMLYDPEITSAGAEVFEKYETMMDRSTKVLFFHTENYKADNMFLRVQNGAVYQQLEHVKKDREKCIPVFPDGACKSGLAMAGIVGLDLTLPFNFNNCMLATFSEQVRKVRILKESRCMKIRQELFDKLLHSILKHTTTNGDSMNEFVNTHATLALVKNILSSLSAIHGMELPKHFAVQEDYDEKSNCNTTTTVNISGTASNIHVGPKVVLNINVGSEPNEE